MWATVSGHLLDASLGYFINPLVSIALGTLVLRERLRRLQWIAIALAAIGVAFLTWRAGRVPWVALVLAVTFGLYGLVRKTVRVEALVGSTIETLLLAPIAVIYLALRGSGALPAGDPQTVALLVGTGVVTAIPLILFTARRAGCRCRPWASCSTSRRPGSSCSRCSRIGEPLAHDRLIAFVWIWIGLFVFSVDLVQATRNRQI